MTDPIQSLLSLTTGRRGHFEMESGYHADHWSDIARLFDDPPRSEPLISALANQLRPHRIDVVCGPLVGGATLAERIASHLAVPHVMAERIVPPPSDAPGLFPIKYSIATPSRESVRGKRVAIVDDAISAGSAVRGTFADLVACGATPVALGTLLLVGHAVEPFAAEHHLPL